MSSLDYEWEKTVLIAQHIVTQFLAVSLFVYLLNLVSALEDLERTLVVDLAQKTMR